MTNTTYEATNSDVEKLIKYARINAECGEHASPEEILKLVAALENERKQKNSWKNLAKKSISERSIDIEALLSARQRIAELESRPLCVKPNDAMREAAPLCVKSPEDFPDDAELLIEIEFLDDVSVDIKTAQWLKELRRRRAACGTVSEVNE